MAVHGTHIGRCPLREAEHATHGRDRTPAPRRQPDPPPSLVDTQAQRIQGTKLNRIDSLDTCPRPL